MSARNSWRSSSLFTCVRTRGGSAHHQLRFDGNFRNVLRLALNAVEQRTRRGLSHFFHGLSHSREWRTDVGRVLDVIEAHHRQIIGHTQASKKAWMEPIAEMSL